MLVDLAHTKSSDGVTLSGIVLEPETPRTDLLVDAMVMVHGSAGNFYLSPSNPRAARLRDMGVPTALFNTRGHDVVGGRAGKTRTGNAYEMLSETHLDLQAMVDFMVDRGYARVGIWGSSLGAVRVVLAQAKNQDPRVAGGHIAGSASVLPRVLLAMRDGRGAPSQLRGGEGPGGSRARARDYVRGLPEPGRVLLS